MSRLSRIRQKGFASVELALITPALVIMLLVAAEFSRVFYEFNTLTKGVRDAARFAAEASYNNSNKFVLSALKISQAKNIAVYGNINGAGAPILQGLTVGNITVAQRNLGAAPLVREHVQVTGTYTFQPLSPAISGLGFLPQSVGMNFTLVAQSTMRGL